jgi:hypothetical protein
MDQRYILFRLGSVKDDGKVRKYNHVYTRVVYVHETRNCKHARMGSSAAAAPRRAVFRGLPATLIFWSVIESLQSDKSGAAGAGIEGLFSHACDNGTMSGCEARGDVILRPGRRARIAQTSGWLN